ncbi:type IV pilin protein [Teredinibacter purpureus]|uniref:type IV pilin protein n=1 Tax=Teredinibacter purpureus TaxID=2731756 RepID=UPI0005F86FC5|nr:type IV pilin protein [Teredinibacter purpureus]
MNSEKGFTITELMIVLVIIGVLSSIAIPAYRGSVLKTNRAEGIEALIEAAQNQEVLYSQTNRYSTNAKPFIPVEATITTENGYYTISVANGACGTNACYTATATAISTQVQDTTCLTLSIDNLGSKTSTPTGNSCWR